VKDISTSFSKPADILVASIREICMNLLKNRHMISWWSDDSLFVRHWDAMCG